MLLNPARFGSSYAANAVSFNRNTYLTRGADFTGAANSSQGIFSAWLNFNAANGSLHEILTDAGGGYDISRLANSKIRIIVTDGTKILDFRTSNTYTTSSGWIHILASWDTNYSAGNKLSHLYINDTSDKVVENDTDSAFNVDYTSTDHAVGGVPSGTSLLGADVAEVYFAPGQFLDFSNSTNRRKFISASGDPVSLGSDGSTPTGVAPILYLKGQATTFATNLGSGGGMTTNGGTLANAGTSP